MDDLIDEHLQSLVGTHTAETIKARGGILRHLHADLPFGLGYASTKDLQAWINRPHLSVATKSAYAAHIAAAYEFWAELGVIDGNPAAKLDRPKQRRGKARPAKEAHIAILLSLPEPIPTITLLGAYEGLRRAEICGLDREHITEEFTTIVRPKGGRGPQTVPTHPLVWEHVKHMPPGPVARSRRGGRMTTTWLTHLWAQVRAKAGLPEDLVPHMLRHRYGTVIQREGRDLRVTQECMRHASVATTQIYTMVTDEQRSAAVRLLPSVSSEPVRTWLGAHVTQ